MALAPIAVWTDDPTAARAVIAVVGLLVAVAAGVAAGRSCPQGSLLGLVAVAGACLALSVVPPGVITWVISAALGGGAGVIASPLASARLGRRGRRRVLVAAVGLAGAVVGAALVGPTIGLAVVVVVAAAAAVTGRRLRTSPPRTTVRARLAVVAPVVLTAGLLAWVGANDPSVDWFGPVVRHGDRTVRRVALTFDDGPAASSLAVADVLDAAGVAGTFFVVGKAVDARPDLARALVARGHLLANHSYHHDYWRWLDPRYPELARTQASIARATGVCPSFFRPPHGQRTPFMSGVVAGRDMDTVLWDVSAADWTPIDGAEVARRVLAQVRPGSVILLHDAIDGRPDADRSVLVNALPLILAGLRDRGLEPVRLDQLLGRAGTLTPAACGLSVATPPERGA